VNLRAREHLRLCYRPESVRFLFVGEAPPASGKFFYRADSGLYRAIRDTFMEVVPSIRNEKFLESFRLLDCYLVDLCATPVDQLSSQRRKRARLKPEARLTRIVKEISPKILITVVRSISANVKRAQMRANWTGTYYELPYPGRWKRHRLAFADQLGAILQQQIDKRV
jgi:hypothetical protein